MKRIISCMKPNIDELLDLKLGAYTLVTYRLADLHPKLRDAMECIIVKRTAEPHESPNLNADDQARGACLAVMQHLDSLSMNEAILLPGMREAAENA